MGPEKSGPIPIVGKERNTIKKPGTLYPELFISGE